MCTMIVRRCGTFDKAEGENLWLSDVRFELARVERASVPSLMGLNTDGI